MLDPYFSATKMAWMLRHADLALSPDDPGLAFCTVDTWILWNLTGGPNGGTYATDPSNASRTLLFDTETLAWSDELCALFGVPPHTLAEVRPSVGELGTTALADLGAASSVLDGVPVCGVLGDQQAALFGQACFDPGMAKVTYGTGSFVLANVGTRRPAGARGPHRRAAPGTSATHADAAHGRVTYALEGSAFVSGAAIQWLRDGIGVVDSSRGGRRAGGLGPRQRGRHLRARAERSGQPVVGPPARGIVTGITRGAGRAQLARACVEAMAFQVRDMTDAMRGHVRCGHVRWCGRRIVPRPGRCGLTVVLPPWISSSSCRPSTAASRWPAPSPSSRPLVARPRRPAWPWACGRRSTSWPDLGGRGRLRAKAFRSSWPTPSYGGWRRAIEKSMGWASDDLLEA